MSTPSSFSEQVLALPAGAGGVNGMLAPSGAAVSPDGLVSLDAQFFLWATLPVEDGSARGIQCTWVVAEILDGAVSEDTALSLMVSSMSSNQDTLDSYVDEHPQ